MSTKAKYDVHSNSSFQEPKRPDHHSDHPGSKFDEGQQASHLGNDAKDERSIANKLAAEEKKASQHHEQHNISQKDPTLPARNQGHEPSKGAKLDAELKEDDEAILKKKGIK